MSSLQTEVVANGQSSDMRMDVDSAQPDQPIPFPSRRRPRTEGRRASSVPAKRPRVSDSQVGYVYDASMLFHACSSPDGHPEQPARIARIHDALKTANILEKMQQLSIREVQREEVLLVHSETLWDKVMAIAGRALIGHTTLS